MATTEDKARKRAAKIAAQGRKKVVTAAETVKGSYEGVKDTVGGDVTRAVDATKQAASTARTKAKEAVPKVKEQAVKVGSAAKEKAVKVGEVAKEKAVKIGGVAKEKAVKAGGVVMDKAGAVAGKVGETLDKKTEGFRARGGLRGAWNRTAARFSSKAAPAEQRVVPSEADLRKETGYQQTVRKAKELFTGDKASIEADAAAKAAQEAEAEAGAKKPSRFKTMRDAFDQKIGGQNMFRRGLRRLGVAGAAYGSAQDASDVYKVSQDPQASKLDVATQAGEAVGKFGTAGAGAAAGAGIGATIGSAILPVAGTAVGGVLGGLAGGAAGYWGGEKAIKGLRGAFGLDTTSPIERTNARMPESAPASAPAPAPSAPVSMRNVVTQQGDIVRPNTQTTYPLAGGTLNPQETRRSATLPDGTRAGDVPGTGVITRSDGTGFAIDTRGQQRNGPGLRSAVPTMSQLSASPDETMARERSRYGDDVHAEMSRQNALEMRGGGAGLRSANQYEFARGGGLFSSMFNLAQARNRQVDANNKQKRIDELTKEQLAADTALEKERIQKQKDPLELEKMGAEIANLESQISDRTTDNTREGLRTAAEIRDKQGRLGLDQQKFGLDTSRYNLDVAKEDNAVLQDLTTRATSEDPRVRGQADIEFNKAVLSNPASRTGQIGQQRLIQRMLSAADTSLLEKLVGKGQSLEDWITGGLPGGSNLTLDNFRVDDAGNMILTRPVMKNGEYVGDEAIQIGEASALFGGDFGDEDLATLTGYWQNKTGG